jgi:hypothetical protein
MISEAMQWIKTHAAPVTIHTEEGRIVTAYNGKMETIHPAVNKPGGHSFETLPGLCDYLMDPACGEGDVLVLVGKQAVIATLDYPNQPKRQVRLNLLASEERAALEKITKPIGQKELWRLLYTDLAGTIDDELLYAVSNMDVKIEGEVSVKIGAAGVGQTRASEVIRVDMPTKGGASQTLDLKKQWQWTGKLWRCFEYDSTVNLTLEIHTSGGVGFQFHPRRMDEVIDQARRELVRELTARLIEVCDNVRTVDSGKTFHIFEGE